MHTIAPDQDGYTQANRIVAGAVLAAACGGAALTWGSMLAALLFPANESGRMSALYSAVYIALDIAYLVVLFGLANWPRSPVWRIPLGLALPAWLIGIALLLIFERSNVVAVTITLNSAVALFLCIWGVLILSGRVGRTRALPPAFAAMAALQSSSDLYWAGQTYAGDPCNPSGLVAPALIAPAMWLGLLAACVIPAEAHPTDRRTASAAQMLLAGLIAAGAALGWPHAVARLSSGATPADAVMRATPVVTFAWTALCALIACNGAARGLRTPAPPRPAWTRAGLCGAPARRLSRTLAICFAGGVACVLLGSALTAAALPAPFPGMLRSAGMPGSRLVFGALITAAGAGLLVATWGLLVDFGTPGAGIEAKHRWTWWLAVGLTGLLVPGSMAVAWLECASGTAIALGSAGSLGMAIALAGLLNAGVRRVFLIERIREQRR